MEIKQDSNVDNHEWHNMLSPFPVFPDGKRSYNNILIAIEEYFKDHENPEDTWVATDYAVGNFTDPFVDSKYGHDGYFKVNLNGDWIEFHTPDCTKFDTIESEFEDTMYRIIGWKYIEEFSYPGMNECRKALEDEANG